MVGIYHIWRKPTVKSKVSRVVFAVSTNVIRRVLIMLWDDIGKPLSSFFILGGDWYYEKRQ